MIFLVRIGAGADDAEQAGGLRRIQSIQRVLDRDAIRRGEAKSLEGQLIDVRGRFLGGNFVASGDDVEDLIGLSPETCLA